MQVPPARATCAKMVDLQYKRNVQAVKISREEKIFGT